jgi:Flp pilus assembly protein TadB
VSPLVVAFAAASAGLVLAGLAGTLVPPRSRLAGRVRPYTLATRAGLGRSADAFTVAAPTAAGRTTLGRLFGPPLRAGLRQVGRLVDRHDDAALALRLRQAGWYDVTPDDHRMRGAGRAVLFASVGLVLGVAILHSAPLGFLLAFCGAVHGISRGRGALARAIEQRRERLRLELYTVNQLLAMHLRTGAGPVQATQRIVDRGRGAVVEELDGVLAAVRSGMSEAEAFRRAAETTPEPAAARTFRLFAAGAERGVDLAGGLRALSEDLRDARRDEMRKTATKRRAAMLVPTIAVLAPIMLLFVAAPLPSIVFGHH